MSPEGVKVGGEMLLVSDMSIFNGFSFKKFIISLVPVLTVRSTVLTTKFSNLLARLQNTKQKGQESKVKNKLAPMFKDA